jgi:hypothetical protein
MANRFEIVDLAGDQVARALPVVQATWPEVDLASWQGFVKGFEAPAVPGRSGMLALRDASGGLCGLLAYRRDERLRGDAVLTVPLFAAIDLANAPHAVRALLDAAEALASELKCGHVEIRLHEEQGEFVSRLRSLGLTSDACVLRLEVAARVVC